MDYKTETKTIHLIHNITIKESTSLNSIILKLSRINTENLHTINLNIVQNSFIEAPIYLVLISYINNLRESNAFINIVFNGYNCSTHNYASRINVFKHLNIEFIENFQRHITISSLIPISHIEKNVYDLAEDVLSIFSHNFNMSENDVNQISLIINEMICNTTMHSKSKSGAFMYIQRYPRLKTLEFILVDSGIGIKESLSKSDKFRNVTNEEALRLSLDYEVTNGEGRGHGLYFMSEFIKRNNCEMQLISGSNTSTIKNGMLDISQNPHWQGVILKIIFKFDALVPLSEIMNEKYN